MSVDVPSSTDLSTTQFPTPWCDNRSNEHIDDSTMLSHKTTTNRIRTENLKVPEQIKELPERKTFDGPSLKSGSSSNRAGRGGNSIHKKLPELSEVKEIHAHLMESGQEFPLFEKNNVMDMYVKCGGIKDAHLLFDDMPNRNVVSWNILIQGYARCEEGALALELYARMHHEGVYPSRRTFIAALKACSSMAAMEEGKQADGEIVKTGCLEKCRAIHSQAVNGGFDSHVYVGTTLVDTYVKCGSTEDAQHVFDELCHPDVVSWTAMILGYTQKEEGGLALEIYSRMHQEGVHPNDRTFVAALKACSSLATLEEGKQVDANFLKLESLEKGRAIHSQAVKSGFDSDVFVGTVLVDMFVNCGSIEDARHVFDEMPHRNVVSWTAMILGYVQREEAVRALELYEWMHKEITIPDRRTCVGVLKACASLATLEQGKKVKDKILKIESLEKGRAIHSQVVRNGFESDVFVGTTLLDMYAKCGSIEDAWHVFDESPHRDAVSWNAMISGYAQKEGGALALELYAQMQQEGITPDQRTLVGVLKACSSLAALEEGTENDGNVFTISSLEKGRTIHSQAVESGFELDVFVGNTLVDMYAKCGSLVDARHVFDGLCHCQVVTWTAMISGYAHKGEGALALELYTRMHKEHVIPDCRTIVGALKACSSLAALEEWKQVDQTLFKMGCLEKSRAIHSQLVKHGLELNVFVGTSMVDLYAKCGSMEDARHVFDKMQHHDAISLTTMISGYAEQEKSEEALKLYTQMRNQCLLASIVTFVSVLKACGNTAALDTGKECHVEICRFGLESTAIVATALIDMYAKCGSMVDAQQLFNALPTRHLVTWNALLAGYARQVQCEHVFNIFERMQQEGIQPDGLTFLSVLTVCSHAGLVDKGQDYFEAMCKQRGIIPTIEHYTCMIDLLGRAGHVEEAVILLQEMPFQPDVVAWVAVLGACHKWINVEVARHAFEHAVKLNEKDSAAYFLMSNIHAHAREAQ